MQFLVQQILLEQRDFLHSKNIRIGRQALIMLGNGAVFMTNFFALRGMANAKYPGFEREGTLWFPDLTAIDPNYILPLVSGLTMAAVVRLGVESGASSDQLSPLMRVGMQYALPIVVALSSSQFASVRSLFFEPNDFQIHFRHFAFIGAQQTRSRSHTRRFFGYSRFANFSTSHRL